MIRLATMFTWSLRDIRGTTVDARALGDEPRTLASNEGSAHCIQGFWSFGQADVLASFSRAPGSAIHHLPGFAEFDALIHECND